MEILLTDTSKGNYWKNGIPFNALLKRSAYKYQGFGYAARICSLSIWRYWKDFSSRYYCRITNCLWCRQATYCWRKEFTEPYLHKTCRSYWPNIVYQKPSQKITMTNSSINSKRLVQKRNVFDEKSYKVTLQLLMYSKPFKTSNGINNIDRDYHENLTTDLILRVMEYLI